MKLQSFRTQLRALRTQAGLTQEGLADLLGTTVGTIKNWESGRTEPPAERVLTQSDILRAVREYRKRR